MNAAVAETVYDAHVARSDCELLPITGWEKLTSISSPKRKLTSKRLPGGGRMIELDVALDLADDTSVKPITALLAKLNHSLRADSPDAPDTHAEAMRRGEIWIQSETKELNNHKVNASWETIRRPSLETSFLLADASTNSSGSTRSSATARPSRGSASRARRSRKESTSSKSSPLRYATPQLAPFSPSPRAMAAPSEASISSLPTFKGASSTVKSFIAISPLATRSTTARVDPSSPR